MTKSKSAFAINAMKNIVKNNLVFGDLCTKIELLLSNPPQKSSKVVPVPPKKGTTN